MYVNMSKKLDADRSADMSAVVAVSVDTAADVTVDTVADIPAEARSHAGGHPRQIVLRKSVDVSLDVRRHPCTSAMFQTLAVTPTDVRGCRTSAAESAASRGRSRTFTDTAADGRRKSRIMYMPCSTCFPCGRCVSQMSFCNVRELQARRADDQISEARAHDQFYLFHLENKSCNLRSHSGPSFCALLVFFRVETK